RYGAYRAFGVNHIIHHRAQLGTYIRLLNHTLPGTYGPSADGM
ncbi:MAG: DinB family protein, partial [Acidobacteriota bacterium]|nr:DinB family protein [Acidobacteriota bacterium]